MKTILFLIALFLMNCIGFSQSDCPGRAENEKFINEFIKKDLAKKNPNNSVPPSSKSLQNNKVQPEEPKQYEHWDLRYKEIITYKAGHFGRKKDEVLEPEWMAGYSSQEDCRHMVLSLMADVYSDAEGSLAIQIIEDCLPDNMTKEKYILDKGHWRRKNPETEKQTDKTITQNSLGESLKKNLQNIPCGILITDIKIKENGKYEIVIEQKQGGNSAKTTDNAALRKALDEFYARLRMDFENKKQERNVHYQIKPNQEAQKPFPNGSETNVSEQSSLSTDEGNLNPQQVFSQNTNKANVYGQVMPGEDGEPDFIRVEGYQGSTVDFHYDKEGHLLYYTEYDKDGSITTYSDNNNNGLIDKQATIIPGEKPQYKEIDEPQIKNSQQDNIFSEKNEVHQAIVDKIINENSRYLKNQEELKFGADGHITKVVYESENSKGKREILNVNGIICSEEDAIKHAEDESKLFQGNVTNIYNDNNFLDQQTESSHTVALKAFEVLMDGKELLIVAHSGGANVVKYGLISELQPILDDIGKGYLMRNITVITLGGDSSPGETWETSAKIIDFSNEGDLVPPVRGHGNYYNDPYNLSKGLTFKSHEFESYFKWLKYYQEFGRDEVMRRQKLNPNVK